MPRLAAEGWVVDGNYFDEVGAALVWPAADVVVWLDIPRRTAFRRAVVRTARRVVGRRALWNGNRETVTNLGPANLVRLWRRWPDYGRRIDELRSARPETTVVRLRSDRDVRRWLVTT